MQRYGQLRIARHHAEVDNQYLHLTCICKFAMLRDMNLQEPPDMFGHRLRELRKRSELTQVELAELLEVDPTYVSKLESGRLSPSEDLVRRIAAEFGVNETELLLLADHIPADVRDMLRTRPDAVERLVSESTAPRSSGDCLFDDILARLANVSDGKLFERCACALLQEAYASLASWPGGSDGGVDGVIEDEDGNIILVVTTAEDIVPNVKRSLKSYMTRGGEARRIVIATSQSITPPRRWKLDKVAREQGFSIVNVHAREDIAERLYRDERWLRDLLGLTGQPSALSVIPKTRRPQLAGSLVGREDDIERLRGINRDALVLGRPGIGKTAVLRKLALDGWGVFLVDDDTTNIANALRRNRPKVVIVDDAALHLEALRTLIHLRAQAGSDDFSIVSVCWSADKDRLLEEMSLPAEAAFELEPLTRDQIVEVVNSRGLRGPTGLVRHIVDQSRGRPGLATHLTYLALGHGYRDVVSGEAVKRSLLTGTDAFSDQRVLQVLAVISLSGDSGLPRELVAEILEAPVLELYALTAQLAEAGVIDEAARGTHVVLWPEALRYALVGEALRRPNRLLPPQVLDAMPNRWALAQVLVRARLHGIPIEDQQLWAVVQETSAADPEYAALGPDHTRRLLELRPHAALNIAPEALTQAPQMILPALLERAVGDTRGIPQTPEHPLRKVEDWITYSPRQGGEPIRRRTVLLGTVQRWAADGGDLEVAARALSIVLDPSSKTGSLDPGSGTRYSWSQGYIASNDVRDLKDLWLVAKDVVRSLNKDGLFLLVDVIRDYVHPMGIPLPASTEVADAMTAVACDMLRDMVVFSAGEPGVLYELKDLARQAHCDVEIQLNPDFEAVYPQWDYFAERDWQLRGQQHLDGLSLLAERLASSPPEEGVRQLEAFLTWAPRRVPPVVSQPVAALGELTARRVTNPGEWVAALLQSDSVSWLAGPFLNRMMSEHSPERFQWIRAALQHPTSEWAAIAQVLQDGEADDEVLAEVMPRLPDYSEGVHVMCLRGQVPEAILRSLLVHPDPRVASGTATGVWYANREGEVPEALYGEWRAAVLRGPIGFSDVGLVVKDDPELAREWLLGRIQDGSWIHSHARHDYAVQEAAKSLDSEGRVAVLRSLAKVNESEGLWFVAWELMRMVVADDLSTFRAVLNDPELRRLHLIGLVGVPDETWPERATAALDAGYEPQRVARAAYDMQTWSWMGPESALWEQWRQAFAALKAPPDEADSSGWDKRLVEVARLGELEAIQRRDWATQKERQEDVYGR